MTTRQHRLSIWADKGALTDHNPRYLHARLLAGSGYTPEPVEPPEGWFRGHAPDVFPVTLIVGDDWEFLEDSEDISTASRLKIALEVVRGFRHIRNCKRAIIWDTKPEHMMVVGFCPPDDTSHIAVKFVDLETIFLLDEHTFSMLGEPTAFTLNSIARQQSILLQGGLFDPETEVIESLIDCLRAFNQASGCPSQALEQALSNYWAKTIICTFDNFLECIGSVLNSLTSIGCVS